MPGGLFPPTRLQLLTVPLPMSLWGPFYSEHHTDHTQVLGMGVWASGHPCTKMELIQKRRRVVSLGLTVSDEQSSLETVQQWGPWRPPEEYHLRGT